MKFFLQTALIALTGVAAPLAADILTVTVVCDNGSLIGNLPITVYDFEGEEVSDISSTNSEGVFVINDSQNYTAPFYLFFKSQSGSSCGAYNVVENGADVGFVYLNYYPTELPCSCSKLSAPQGFSYLDSKGQ